MIYYKNLNNVDNLKFNQRLYILVRSNEAFINVLQKNADLLLGSKEDSFNYKLIRTQLSNIFNNKDIETHKKVISNFINDDEAVTRINSVKNILNNFLQDKEKVLSEYKKLIKASPDYQNYKELIKKLYKSLKKSMSKEMKYIQKVKKELETIITNNENEQTNEALDKINTLYKSLNKNHEVLLKFVRDNLEKTYKNGGELDKKILFDEEYWSKRVEVIKKLTNPEGFFIKTFLSYLSLFMYQFSEQGEKDPNSIIYQIANYKEIGSYKQFKKNLKNVNLDGKKIEEFIKNFNEVFDDFIPTDGEIKTLNDGSKFKPYLDFKEFNQKKLLIDQYKILILRKASEKLSSELNNLNIELTNLSEEAKPLMNEIINWMKEIKKRIKKLKERIEQEQDALAYLPESFTTNNNIVFEDLINKLSEIENYELVKNVSDYFKDFGEFLEKNRKEIEAYQINEIILSAKIEYNNNKLENIKFNKLEDDFKKHHEEYEKLYNKVASEESYIIQAVKNKGNINLERIKEEISAIHEIIDKLDEVNIKLFEKIGYSRIKIDKKMLELDKSKCVLGNVINRFKYEYFTTQKMLKLWNLLGSKDKKESKNVEKKNELDKKMDDLERSLTAAKDLTGYKKIIKAYGSKKFFKDKFSKKFELKDDETYKSFKKKKIDKNLLLFIRDVNDYHKNLEEMIKLIKKIRT